MWPFKKSKPADLHPVREWLRQQVATGLTIGEIQHNLYHNFPESIFKEKGAHLEWSRIESELGAILTSRNTEGREMEKQGRVDEAINLYEANVADKVDAPFPYDRLRIIYTKRKDYQNAIRVCEAFLETNRRYYPDFDRSKFEGYLAKLRERP